jgi:hypothetical protein
VAEWIGIGWRLAPEYASIIEFSTTGQNGAKNITKIKPKDYLHWQRGSGETGQVHKW